MKGMNADEDTDEENENSLKAEGGLLLLGGSEVLDLSPVIGWNDRMVQSQTGFVLIGVQGHRCAPMALRASRRKPINSGKVFESTETYLVAVNWPKSLVVGPPVIVMVTVTTPRTGAEAEMVAVVPPVLVSL